MDFNTLSRRQLQFLCKNNKIPANITNVAMANALNALEFVEGIEEFLNPSETKIPQSPMVHSTGGGTRTAKGVGVLKTPGAAPTTATRRRAAAASTSVRRKIEVSSNESLDENKDVKRDVSVKTPSAAAPASRRRGVRETSTVKHVYNTRRSARLAEKTGEQKERSEAIKINSFTEEVDENVEVAMKECSVDQSEISDITVLDNLKECSEESEVKSNDESKEISEGNSNITNGVVGAVASIEQRVASDVKITSDQVEDGPVDGLMKEGDDVVETNAEADEERVGSEEIQENKGKTKDIKINSHKDEEVNASFEDTKTNSNVDADSKASIDNNVDEETEGLSEDTEMYPNVAEETEAFIEKDTEKNSSEVEEVNAPFEGTKMDSNVDEEAKASIDSNVDEETKAPIEATGIVGGETMASTEENDMNSNMYEEAKAPSEFTEKTEVFIEKGSEMNSNEDEEVTASFEYNEMNLNVDEEAKASVDSNVDEDTKASTEDTGMNSKVGEETEMNSNVDEEAKASSEVNEMNSNVDDETKAPIAVTDMISEVDEECKASIAEDTDVNSNEDEEIDVAEYKVADSCHVEKERLFNHDDPVKEHEAYAKEIENHGDMVANVTVNIQGIDNEEFDMSDENETSDDEESGMSDENEISDDEESDMSDESETSEDEESEMSNISGDRVANVTLNMQETDSEESNMSDEIETLDDEELLDMPNITHDMVSNVTVNTQETDKEESYMSEENVNSDHQEDMVVPEIKIQDGLGKDELVDAKDNLESNFADDVPVDILVPEVKIQDELLNSEATHESNFADDVPEDILVPKVEIQDEPLNSEAKHESSFSTIGDAAAASTDVSDPTHIVDPLISDDLVYSIEPLKKSLIKTPSKKSANRTPKTVRRLTQVSDDKENVDSGRKSVMLIDEKPTKKPLEDFSIRQLSKMFKEKAQISKQSTKEDGKEDENVIKATPTRLALKALSENCMAAESQN